MEKEKVTKPDGISQSIWSDNQQWIKLMSQQAEEHRASRDPRLYRQSSKKRLISPINDNLPEKE
jgi:hypothetical protein